MQFQEETQIGTILKRYKRFLSDIELQNDEIIIAHTPNTGSMKTCWEPGWKAFISKSPNPKRKLPFTLEMTHNGDTWINVNTSRTNKLAVEAIENGIVKELQDFELLKTEKKIGDSRIDIYLEHNGKPCYVEVKNVTLLGAPDKATFPDSVSTRGLKHLEELMKLKAKGIRACMLYIVCREDVNSFGPAYSNDPAYSHALKKAYDQGVEILVYQCKLSETEISVTNPLTLEFNEND